MRNNNINLNSTQHLLMLLVILFAISFTSCNHDGSELIDAKVALTTKADLKFPIPSSSAISDSRGYNENEGKVKGHLIPLTFFGNDEFDNYKVKVKDGLVDGDFEVVVYDAITGERLEDAAGIITCVTFEDDGRTARLGGIVTESETLPLFIGTYALWTVVDNHGLGIDDQTTDLRIGVPEFVRDFHCTVGFPVEDFGGTFQSTTGNIKVKSGFDVDSDDE